MQHDIMEYKGLIGKVGFNANEKTFFGEVVGAKIALNFQGDSVEQLTTCFHTAVDEYFEFCQEQGIAPEKSWKGKLTFRPRSDELRQKIWITASAVDLSVNEWLNAVVEKELDAIG